MRFIEGRYGIELVKHESWVWNKAQLGVHFRYIRNCAAFRGVYNKKLTWCSRLGQDMPRQTLPLFAVRDIFVANAFPEMTPYCERIQVPCGCRV